MLPKTVENRIWKNPVCKISNKGTKLVFVIKCIGTSSSVLASESGVRRSGTQTASSYPVSGPAEQNGHFRGQSLQQSSSVGAQGKLSFL